MLGEFMRWWGASLRDLLPAWLRAGQAADRHAVFAAPEPGFVVLTQRRAGAEVPLGRFSLEGAELGLVLTRTVRPAPLLLRIPRAALLEREVVLPLAAERELERVLTYEMDRLTPFAAGDVFWTAVIDRRDRVGGRLHLRLLLAPRAPWTGVLAALAAAGRPVSALVADDRSRTIPLRRQAAGPWPRRLLATGVAACVALAAAAVALPFAAQNRDRGTIEARIAALRPQIAAVESLQRQAAGTAAGQDVVAAERARVGDPLAVLAALTDILPDDTFLTEFAMRQGRIEMAGQSPAAARLIAALSADPVIRNAAFAAPVTRLDGNRGELFSIRAEVAR